jgi:transcriptional regulator with XRE-family HTH domain
MGHIQKVIGNNVKNARTQAGYTQQVLAEKADISIPFLAQIENGSRGPSLEVVEKLAAALQIKPYQLLLEGKAEPLADRRNIITGYSKDLRKEIDNVIKQIERKHLSD